MERMEEKIKQLYSIDDFCDFKNDTIILANKYIDSRHCYIISMLFATLCFYQLDLPPLIG